MISKTAKNDKEIVIDIAIKSSEEIYDWTLKIKTLMETTAEILPKIIENKKLDDKEVIIWSNVL